MKNVLEELREKCEEKIPGKIECLILEDLEIYED